MGSTSVTLPVWIQGCFFLTVGLNVLFIFTPNVIGSHSLTREDWRRWISSFWRRFNGSTQGDKNSVSIDKFFLQELINGRAFAGKLARCPAGVRADFALIFTFPGSPALCLPVGRQGRRASDTESAT